MLAEPSCCYFVVAHPTLFCARLSACLAVVDCSSRQWCYAEGHGQLAASRCVRRRMRAAITKLALTRGRSSSQSLLLVCLRFVGFRAVQHAAGLRCEVSPAGESAALFALPNPYVYLLRFVFMPALPYYWTRALLSCLPCWCVYALYCLSAAELCAAEVSPAAAGPEHQQLADHPRQHLSDFLDCSDEVSCA